LKICGFAHIWEGFISVCVRRFSEVMKFHFFQAQKGMKQRLPRRPRGTSTTKGYAVFFIITVPLIKTMN